MGIGVAIAGLVVSSGAAYKQHETQKEIYKDQKELNRVSANKAKIDQMVSRRNEARKEAIMRAGMMNEAAISGMGQSSGVQGQLGGLSTASTMNTANYQQSLRTSDYVSGINRSLANNQSRSDRWGFYGSMGSTLTQAGMAYEGYSQTKKS